MTKNKKKTAREKRILVGAFLTAVVIAAGSTFAWFTSTDTVTNRLSANADYNVKIVESFAPPENWMPGEKVDKDVYAVNTGNIEAFAKATVSGVMSITREVPVSLDELNIAADPENNIAERTEYTAPHWQSATVSGETVTWDDADINEEDLQDLDETDTDAPEGATKKIGDTYYKLSEPTWNVSSSVYNCVELSSDEVYVIEAGAYLAYKPKADEVNKTLGNKAIGFREPTQVSGSTTTYYFTGGSPDRTDWSVIEAEDYVDDNSHYKETTDGAFEGDPTNANKTDFQPHADGLYVFRRSIVVANTESGHSAGTETFDYEGYYFLGGKYYKIMNLTVTPDDKTDVAADGITTDGQLASATAYLVREETVYDLAPDSFEYDAANNRLVATYGTTTENTLVGSDDNLRRLAAELDKAEHELTEAEVLLERTLADKGIVDESVKDKTKAVDDKQKAYNEALDHYNDAVANYKQARESYVSADEAFNTAATKAKAALKDLAGEDGSVSSNPLVTKADIENDEYVVPQGETTGTLTNVNTDENATTTIKPTGGAAKTYGEKLVALDTWAEDNLIVNPDTQEQVDHFIFVYLKELADANNADGAASNQYELPQGWDGEDAPTGVDTNRLLAELKIAASKITYQFAERNVAFTKTLAEATLPDDVDIHQYHQLLIDLKIAEKDYNEKLTAYNLALGSLDDAIRNLGTEGSGEFNEFGTGEVTIAAIDDLDTWKSDRAEELKDAYAELTNRDEATFDKNTVLNKIGDILDVEDIANWAVSDPSAERDLYDAWQALEKAKKDLEAVRDKTYIKPAGEEGAGLPYGGPNYTDQLGPDGNPIIDDSTVDDGAVKSNLQLAWDNYYQKKNAADEAARNLKSAQNGLEKDGPIKIYIYLQNVTLAGNEADKWQLLPIELADIDGDGKKESATFYYTSILTGGEVSSQLIDYVELDSGVEKEMYKYFDFDLNVKLDSAQVVYDDGGNPTTRALEEATSTGMNAFDDDGVTGSITPLDGNGTLLEQLNRAVITWGKESDAETTHDDIIDDPDNP